VVLVELDDDGVDTEGTESLPVDGVEPSVSLPDDAGGVTVVLSEDEELLGVEPLGVEPLGVVSLLTVPPVEF